jgi:hypothetical protein
MDGSVDLYTSTVAIAALMPDEGEPRDAALHHRDSVIA